MTDLTLTNSVVTRSRFATDELRTERGCHRAFEQLADMPDEELGQEDIGLVNLLCAVGLPSADPLNIPHCLEQLDQLAEYVRHEIIKGYPRYLANPNPTKGSEAVYKLWALMHAIRIKCRSNAGLKGSLIEQARSWNVRSPTGLWNPPAAPIKIASIPKSVSFTAFLVLAI